MLRNKLMTACSVAVLTAALYGCSSSSDDGPNMQVQDLQDQISALEAALGEGHELTPAGLEALVSDLATAERELEVARAALEMATDNSADEMEIARLTKAVTDAETMRDDYKTKLDTANAELADRIKEDEAKDAADAKKERIAREKAIRAAITDTITVNRVGTDAKPLPIGTEPALSGVSGVAVTRDADDKLTVDVNGAETDDVYADVDGETTAGSGDWNSVTMTRTDAGTEAEDTLVIYTDIDAPADVDIETVYTTDGGDNLLDNALMFANTDDVRYGKAQSDDFPSVPGATLTYGTGGLDSTVLGTFDGVAGAFKCTVAPSCTVTVNAMGNLASATGWRFTPASPLDATVKVPDEDYAYFGWWLNKPKLNTAQHDVEVFAGGSSAEHALDTLPEAIVGTATYAGPAAGKYVTQTFTAGAQIDAGVGHFTAHANLTANFGLATNAGTNIGGSVSGFELDDGSNPGWTVKLENVALSDYTGGNFDGTTEVNFGNGLTDSAAAEVGTWQGTFYGAGEGADAPDAVVGTFDAVTDFASVIGGFGATKQ